MSAPMNPYEQRVAAFYDSFRSLDAKAMRAAYASNARFADPVFRLQGANAIGAMWAMLCEAIERQGRDVWRLDVIDIRGDADSVNARWEPHYRFSATGRMVHNIIDASLRFDADGLITTHRDQFDFWRWSRQALGPVGWALGWSPLLLNKVRAQAKAGLEAQLRKR